MYFDKVFDEGTNSCKIFNLIPGKKYVYRVDVFGTTIQKGVIGSSSQKQRLE